MRLKTKRQIQLAIIPTLVGVLAGTAVTGTMLMIRFSKFRSDDVYDYLEAKNIIDEYYYKEAGDTDYLSMALKGMVVGLDDPYACYMTPEELSEHQVSNSGSLIGIGVSVMQDENGDYIIGEVHEDSPAAESGIEVGDIIYSVEGKIVNGMDFNELISYIRGDEDTSFNMTVTRNGKQIEKTLTRKTIESVTVEYTQLEGKIGYIKINSFKEVTAKQFLEAMKSALLDESEGIIFDLRDNGGGIVDACEKCLDPLLPEGKVAVAEYRDGHEITICESDDKEIHIPMTVIVNGNTASAAELFSAALRDFGKAELVGENTFGKGIMQDTFTMSNGGAVKITVARYRTTKSECFHEVGLKPDYEVKLPEGTDISKPDITKDTQLKKAVDVVKKK